MRGAASLQRGLANAPALIARASSYRAHGIVVSAVGSLVEAKLPGAVVGDGCRFEGGALGEIVGFRAGLARILVLGSGLGLGPGTKLLSTGRVGVEVGEALLGRVVDANGRCIDSGPAIDRRGLERVALERGAPDPMTRKPIAERLVTGIRAVDGLCAMGRGQRIGLFAGPGSGKSTLLGDLASGAEVDVVVAALVGERGREVREVLEGPLSKARDRSVVVVAGGDSSPLERARATMAATSIAEHFRDAGASVLLLVDSLTRFARALREIALAGGESPARGGYPPSALAALPRLIERAGPAATGEITAVYTVLSEDEGASDVVSEEVRGLVDGHVVLARRLAERNHWPAIDVPASLSRVSERVADPVARRSAGVMRRLIADYEERRDLVVLGAYQEGRDAEADEAVRAWPRLESFLRQRSGERSPIETTLEAMHAVTGGGS